MIRKVVVAVLLVLLLMVATHLAISAWAKQRLKRLETTWQEEVFRGEAPATAYPARETDAAARRVEDLAAEMGVHFRSSDPTSVAGAAEFDPKLREAGSEYLRRAVAAEGFEVGPFPAVAAQAIDTLQPTIDALVEAVLSESPRWGFDIERGVEMAEVDYSAHRELHRLLILSSWSALAAGEDSVARRRADGAAELRRAIEPDPSIIAALIVPSEVAIEIPLQLRLCPEGAPQGGADPDLRDLYRRNLRGEAWAVLQSMSRSEEIAEAGWPVSLLGGALSRAALVHFAEAIESGASALGDAPLLAFDGDAHFKEHSETIPSWNSIARVVHVNGYGGWDVAARTELSRELLAHVRSEQRRPAAVAVGDPIAEEVIQSEVDSALSWHAERSGATTLFSLRGEAGELVSPNESGESARGLLAAYEVEVGRCAVDI